MTEEKMSGDVTIVKKLGEGTYGKVYEVLHEGKERALKVYKNRIPDLIEIDTLSRIRHPNIIPILDVLKKDGDLCSIMPLGDMDLFNYLRTPRSLDTMINIFYKILSAADFLLDQNILPFDLHSANVVMMGDEPLIIDTGSAVRINQRGETVADPVMRIDLRPLENMNDVNKEYSEASVVWGFGILALAIFGSDGIPIYTQEEADKMGVPEVRDNYKKWKKDHFSSVDSIEKTFLADTKWINDEKRRDAVIDLAVGMLNPAMDERYTMKDILQHPLFSSQEPLPTGTVVSSDFTMYPEMKKDVEEIIRTILFDSVMDYRNSKEDGKSLAIPTSAIFGAMYIYRKFISIYGKDHEQRLIVPLQMIYNLYGYKQRLGGSIINISPLDDESIRILRETDDYVKDMVVEMKGIIHPITDYDKAFSRLADLFPELRELDLNSIIKPNIVQIAERSLGPLNKMSVEERYPVLVMLEIYPIYNTTPKDYKPSMLENIRPHNLFLNYSGPSSYTVAAMASLFDRTLFQVDGIHIYEDGTPMEPDVESVLDKSEYVEIIVSAPRKYASGTIKIVEFINES